jgi:hypothetical protein
MLTRELIKLIAVLSFLLGLSLAGSVHAVDINGPSVISIEPLK